MRYTLFFLALIISAVSLAQGKRTVVRGRIVGDLPKTVSFQTYLSIADNIESENLTMTMPPGSNGSFGFIIYTTTPLNFHLLKDEDWIFYNKYIGPGDSMYFVISDTSINFEGKCEECIGFQFAYAAKFEHKDSIAVYQSAWKKLTKYAFADYMAQRLQTHTDYFNEYFKDKAVPDIFRRTFMADEELDYAINIVQFRFRGQYGKKCLADSSYLAYLNRVNYNNPNYPLSHRFGHFMRELTFNLYESMYESAGTERQKVIFKNSAFIRDSIAKSLLQGDAYKYAVYNILVDYAESLEHIKGGSGFDAYYKTADSTFAILGPKMKDNKLYDRIKKRMKEIKAANTPAPDFTAHDLTGKEVHLSDYKGKVVYVDFWGINCAPCIAELPHIKKLQEKYKDNEELVMLYVCLDPKEAVEKFVKEKDFKGIHWYDGKSFASDAARKYKITGIPRYILVDKKGLLVTKDAPRPSSDPSELIDKTLNSY